MPCPHYATAVCKYSITLLPSKFFINVLLLRPNLVSFSAAYIKHKDHEEHKESKIIMEISFVIFVYFVVIVYPPKDQYPFGQQRLKPGKTIESVPRWLSVHGQEQCRSHSL